MSDLVLIGYLFKLLLSIKEYEFRMQAFQTASYSPELIAELIHNDYTERLALVRRMLNWRMQ